MRFRLPHPLVLLLGGVLAAALFTWVLPAGQYQRRTDEASGREVVVPGTYARVSPTPVGVAAAVMAVPRGIVAGADVILTVLLVGGVFALLDSTGALARLVGSLVGKTTRPRLVVIAVSLVFATLGALENMQEELVALIPILLVLSRGLGFGAITALAMSVGACAVGAAFGPTNPFQTGIALRFAEMPPLSMPGLRFGIFGAAVAVWIAWTLAMVSKDDQHPTLAPPATEPATTRDVVMLGITLVAFIPYVIGVVKFDFGFNELSALFLVAGFALGLVSGRDLSTTATDLLKAMETMLAASIFIGVARAISVVLTDGHVIDTIVYGLASPLESLPGTTGGLLMIPIHALLHVPVPSVSGHAVLTMPIMAPVADLIGISRDAAVFAYQTGAGISDMLIPTSGALLAVLLIAKVDYSRWLKFAVPGGLLVAAVGAAGVILAR